MVYMGMTSLTDGFIPDQIANPDLESSKTIIQGLDEAFTFFYIAKIAHAAKFFTSFYITKIAHAAKCFTSFYITKIAHAAKCLDHKTQL